MLEYLGRRRSGLLVRAEAASFLMLLFSTYLGMHMWYKSSNPLSSRCQVAYFSVRRYGINPTRGRPQQHACPLRRRLLLEKEGTIKRRQERCSELQDPLHFCPASHWCWGQLSKVCASLRKQRRAPADPASLQRKHHKRRAEIRTTPSFTTAHPSLHPVVHDLPYCIISWNHHPSVLVDSDRPWRPLPWTWTSVTCPPT